MPSPEISVIVPVYNTGKYLRRCVDSILAQTYTDFELLLIDDGSTDGSGAICDEYAAFDSRVCVFHKPNGGVSSARNLGLDHARGEWIAFVDSDDWIEPEYLACLFSNINGADLSICDFRIKGSSEIWPDKIASGFIHTEELANFYADTFPYCYLTAPWIKLFRKSIIDSHNIRFNERISTIEDTIFVLEYLRWVESISCTDKKLYNYWRQDAGLSQNDELLNSQIFLISANIHSSLCRLAEVRDIEISSLYLKILNSRFLAWVFPQQKSWKELYSHYKHLSALPEMKRMYKIQSVLLGAKYKLILHAISCRQPAMAAIAYKILISHAS